MISTWGQQSKIYQYYYCCCCYHSDNHYYRALLSRALQTADIIGCVCNTQYITKQITVAATLWTN